MDGFGVLQREIESINRRRRNVIEHARAFSPNRFWEQACGQNFLITGGLPKERCHVLAEALCEYRRNFRGPIIVLNGSEEFEIHMIQLAQEGRCGKIVVSSPDYPNYTPFAGLDNVKIRELFQMAGQAKGYSVDLLGDYVEAFLQVLSCRYEADIYSMIAMAELSESEMVDLGASYGVKRIFLDALKSEKYSAEFRQILKDFWVAFQNISAEEATSLSIANIDESDVIYLIWVGSESTDLLSMALAKELLYLQQARRQNLLLVINDAVLTVDNTMNTVIVNAKNRNRFGICSSDVLTGLDSERDLILNNSPALVIMYTGLEDSEDTGSMLEKFGFYMHESIAKGAGAGPGIFHLPGTWAPHVGTKDERRARVRVEDMDRFQVAVRGDHADVVSLYRRVSGY